MDIAKNEVFKDIEGYEGRYQVSNMGRIKSLTGARGREYTGMIRKSYTKKNGYKSLALWIRGSQEYVSIHKLVADYFVARGEYEDDIIHIDGDKGNNKSDNIKWCRIDFEYYDYWDENTSWGEFMYSLGYSGKSFNAIGTHGISTRSARMQNAGFSSSEIIISFDKTNY